MSRLSYTGKLRLEVKMKEFLLYAKPLVDKKTLKEEIKNELMQTVEGVLNGDFGGGYHDDWEEIFYKQMIKNGFIEFTQKGKDRYE